MFKCQYRLPSCHRSHIRRGWTFWLVAPGGGRIHCCRHPVRHRFRSRSAMGSIPPASDAAKDSLSDSLSHHHLRFLNGPRLHGCRIPSHLCLCPRWLFSGFTHHQACKQAHADARKRGLVQYYHWHLDDPAYLRRRDRNRCHFFHSRCCGFRRFHYTDLYQGIFRG